MKIVAIQIQINRQDSINQSFKMPRIARSNDQTALSRQNSENVGNITSIKGKGLPEKQTRGGNNLKRPAEIQTVNNSECNAKTRRRAALGEITNVSKNFNIV